MGFFMFYIFIIDALKLPEVIGNKGAVSDKHCECSFALQENVPSTYSSVILVIVSPPLVLRQGVPPSEKYWTPDLVNMILARHIQK
jgi:hypothetical protein